MLGQRDVVEQYGFGFLESAVTADNHRELLTPLLTAGEGQGFCVNLSVDTSSVDIMRLCRELDVLYIDTVVEPWPGFYYDPSTDNALRTNHALRSTVTDERRRVAGRHDGGVVLWCQPRDGVVVREGGTGSDSSPTSASGPTSRRPVTVPAGPSTCVSPA